LRKKSEEAGHEELPVGIQLEMRGHDEQQEGMFSYISAEKRIPPGHPLRRIRALTDAALQALSPVFAELYSQMGRPSIAPEKLLRALLLQAFYSVRSERLLMEQLDYNLLFRWFVGMNVDEGVWDVTVFTKNRDRLLEGEIAKRFFDQVVAQAAQQGLLSDEHFTVDGTLIEAWANRRSFREKQEPPKGGTGTGGRKLLRDTHESQSDPESRLYKKSAAGEAKPSYLGHVLMENRNGLVVQACVTEAGRKAEREAAEAMLRALRRSEGQQRRGGGSPGERTLAADKGYQAESFIEKLREMSIVPHVAEYETETALSRNWLRASERESPGFAISQGKRKLVEKIFGWMKSAAGLRKTKLRGRRRVDWQFRLYAAAANLIRLEKLLVA
jgi:transposase